MSRFEPEDKIYDEVVVKQIDDWEITASKSRKRIYFKPVSYHPPKMGFTKSDLQELINALDELIK